jgi:leucine dehydrogenase
MPVFDHPEFDDHEQVIFCTDRSVGLQAIVAIHTTRRGPAAGGCRMYPYKTPDDALSDVLRLSRGMSYKNALAGLALGGGKAVIIADPSAANKPRLLTAFAKHIQTINGRYWTAIDVGVGVEDVAHMSRTTDFVFCLTDERAGRLNPAVFTALGGFVSLKATQAYLSGSEDLTGVTVAIQGLGQTGLDLCRQVVEAGGKVVATDVNPDAIAEAKEKYGAEIVAPDDIYGVAADIFAPCALGAILNDDTIPRLKVKAVCGIANNQLAEPRHADALKARGILYAPDYVVNAGGVIYGADDIFKTHDNSTAEAKIRGIGGVLREIFDAAADTGRTTAEIADDLARSRMAG